jgi:hypothetical protein
MRVPYQLTRLRFFCKLVASIIVAAVLVRDPPLAAAQSLSKTEVIDNLNIWFRENNFSVFYVGDLLLTEYNEFNIANEKRHGRVLFKQVFNKSYLPAQQAGLLRIFRMGTVQLDGREYEKIHIEATDRSARYLTKLNQGLAADGDAVRIPRGEVEVSQLSKADAAPCPKSRTRLYEIIGVLKGRLSPEMTDYAKAAGGSTASQRKFRGLLADNEDGRPFPIALDAADEEKDFTTTQVDDYLRRTCQ